MAAKCLKSRTRWPWPEVQGELATRLFCHNFGGNARQHCKKRTYPRKADRLWPKAFLQCFPCRIVGGQARHVSWRNLGREDSQLNLKVVPMFHKCLTSKRALLSFDIQQPAARWQSLGPRPRILGPRLGGGPVGDKSKICDKIFSVMTVYVCSSAEVLETQYGEILSMLLSLLFNFNEISSCSISS